MAIQVDGYEESVIFEKATHAKIEQLGLIITDAVGNVLGGYAHGSWRSFRRVSDERAAKAQQAA